MSRLPDVEGGKLKRQKFKCYPIGFLHIDIGEAQTAEGKLYLFAGIEPPPVCRRLITSSHATISNALNFA
jgi:hypothetical protein